MVGDREQETQGREGTLGPAGGDTRTTPGRGGGDSAGVSSRPERGGHVGDRDPPGCGQELLGDIPCPLGDIPVPSPQEDYFVTPEGRWVPLRWVAPELLGQRRGTLLVAEQSKESNVW